MLCIFPDTLVLGEGFLRQNHTSPSQRIPRPAARMPLCCEKYSHVISIWTSRVSPISQCSVFSEYIEAATQISTGFEKVGQEPSKKN